MNTIDHLEYQARQWGMLSSLTILSTIFLMLAMQLNNLPKLANRRLADKEVSLELRVLPPVRNPVEKPVPEAVKLPDPPPSPQPEPVAEPPAPKPVTEVVNPEPKPRLKPVVRKKKVAKPVQKTKTREPIRKKKAVTAETPPVPVRHKKKALTPVMAAKPAPEPAVYEQAMLDAVPAVIEKSKPAYPHRARRMNIIGSVKIRFRVTRDGKVADLQIVKAEPQGIFEKTVRKTVQTWRFTPGIKNGCKVATWMSTTINFKLE